MALAGRHDPLSAVMVDVLTLFPHSGVGAPMPTL
jgi:hypothetical protein